MDRDPFRVVLDRVMIEFATMRSQLGTMSSEFADVKHDLSAIMRYLRELSKVFYFPLNLSYFVVWLIVEFSKLLFIRILQGKYVDAPWFGGTWDGNDEGEGGGDDMTSDDEDDIEYHVEQQAD